MTVETISWSTSTKVWDQASRTHYPWICSQTRNCSRTCLPIALHGQAIQEISYKNHHTKPLFCSKYDISKCWCDLIYKVRVFHDAHFCAFWRTFGPNDPNNYHYCVMVDAKLCAQHLLLKTNDSDRRRRHLLSSSKYNVNLGPNRRYWGRNCRLCQRPILHF